MKTAILTLVLALLAAAPTAIAAGSQPPSACADPHPLIDYQACAEAGLDGHACITRFYGLAATCASPTGICNYSSQVQDWNWCAVTVEAGHQVRVCVNSDSQTSLGCL